jgi:hypothetical protein
MKRVALILAALLVAACEAPPPPDPRPPALLAELATTWPAEANLQRLAEAAAQCDQKDWAGCYLIRERQAQVSRSVSACWDDESRMCFALRKHVLQVANPAKHFPLDSPVLLPETPFYWRLDNPYLDQLSDVHSYRIEVAKAWFGRIYWYVALVVLCTMVLSLVFERIWRWLRQFNAINNLVRRLRGEKPVKVLKLGGRRARSAATREQATVTDSNTSSRADTNQLDRPFQPEVRCASHKESGAVQPPDTPKTDPKIALGADSASTVADTTLIHSVELEVLAQSAPADEKKTGLSRVRKNYDEDPDLKALTELFSGRPK